MKSLCELVELFRESPLKESNVSWLVTNESRIKEIERILIFNRINFVIV